MALGLSLIGYNAQSGIVMGKETLLGNGDDQGCSFSTGCRGNYTQAPGKHTVGDIKSNCEKQSKATLIGKKGYTASLGNSQTCQGYAEIWNGTQWIPYWTCGQWNSCTESKMEEPEE